MFDIGQQFDIKQLAALQGLLHQHALTKAMDGEDPGPVDIGKSQLQQGKGLWADR